MAIPAPEDLKKLTEKFLQGTITPEEALSLNKWYAREVSGLVDWDGPELHSDNRLVACVTAWARFMVKQVLAVPQ